MKLLSLHYNFSKRQFNGRTAGRASGESMKNSLPRYGREFFL
ncbi:hypothetical protein GCWU000246_00144 [Jonquetella anthropi E3_33 E1]|nr:hypothetical protein GCWU000246_00144 [Jonquetella anthropi E3_33 E1]